MAKTGPQRYPGASTTYWYGSTYPGSAMESNVIVWHTTEGTSLPSYGGGTSAPNFTAVPDLKAKRLVWYQHFDFDVSSRALVNAAGGVETNTLNVVQVEIVGTCDPATHRKWGATPHLYAPELPDWAIRDLGAFARWASDNHGVPLTSAVTFKAYPSSYGANGVRMSAAKWNDFTGHCGHQHVPENDHGDPGAFPMAAILAAAGGTTPPEEDDMVLSVEDIEKVAKRAAELVVDQIFKADVIAAVAPPDENADWHDGNTKWSFAYAIHSPNVVGRETRRLVEGLDAKVDALSVGGVDLDALAAKVADLLAARLAN